MVRVYSGASTRMRAALKAIQAAGGGGGPVYTDAGSSFADIKRFSLYTDGGSGNFNDQDDFQNFKEADGRSARIWETGCYLELFE